MATKICRVTNDGTGDVREDGKPLPKSRYIYPDPNGDSKAAWVWDGPRPKQSEAPFQPPPAPKDMTDEQIAADPMFQLIKRAEKALRTFGPTSKRPILDATNKGFCYVDNTLNVTIWWYGSAWRDAMGAVR